MYRLLGFCFIFQFFALAPATAEEVFRDPASRYSSGEVDRALLEEKTEELRPFHWFKVKTKKKSGWVSITEVLTPLDFAERAYTHEGALLREAANLKLNPKGEIAKNELVKLRLLEGNWAKVEKSWIERIHLKAKTAELGQVISLEDALLYQKPELRSKVLTLLNPSTKLDVLGYHDGWIKVRFGRLKGFVLYEQALHRHHLVARALYQKKWYDIASLKGGQFTTKTKHLLPFRKVRDVTFHENLILASAEGAQLYSQPSFQSKKLSKMEAGQKLEVLERKKVLWGRIYDRSTGVVWWKLTPAKRLRTSVLPTKDLFKRSLFDMDSSPAIPNLKVASARGIFKTIDGRQWQKIDFFKEQNHPIAFADNGWLFIGPHLSKDHGLSFKNYIRWDHFLVSIQKHSKKYQKLELNQVKIVSLKPMPKNEKSLRIRVRIARQTLWLETNDLGKNWRIL